MGHTWARSENGLESYWMAQMTLLGLIRIGRKWALGYRAINGLYANRPLQAFRGLARHLLTKSNGPAFSQEWASVGPCHVSTYHRRLLSNEWMTSVPTMSRHVFPPANDDFTRGKSPLVGAVNGLPDPKPDPIA